MPAQHLAAALGDEDDISAYEHSQRVEVWMIRPDTGLPAPTVSCALRFLSRRGYAWLYSADPGSLGDRGSRNAKLAQLTGEGRAWLGTKKVQETKLVLMAVSACLSPHFTGPTGYTKAAASPPGPL